MDATMYVAYYRIITFDAEGENNTKCQKILNMLENI